MKACKSEHTVVRSVDSLSSTLIPGSQLNELAEHDDSLPALNVSSGRFTSHVHREVQLQKTILERGPIRGKPHRWKIRAGIETAIDCD